MLIKCQGMRGNNSNQIQHYSGKFVVILSILVEEVIEISNSTLPNYFQNCAFLAVFETFLKNGSSKIGKKVDFWASALNTSG